VNNSKQDGNEGKKGVSIPRDLIKKRKLTIANPEIGVDPKKEITTFKNEDEVEEEKNSIKGATEGNMKDIQIEANLPLLYQVTYQTWKSDGNTNCHLESECKYNVKIKKRTGVKCWRCGNPMHRLCEWRTDERTNIRGPYLCSEACSRIINEILKNKNTKSKNIKVNREWRSNGRAVCYNKNKKCKYGFTKITKRHYNARGMRTRSPGKNGQK